MNTGFLWNFHIFQIPDNDLHEQPLQPHYHHMELQLTACLHLTAEFLTYDKYSIQLTSRLHLTAEVLTDKEYSILFHNPKSFGLNF